MKIGVISDTHIPTKARLLPKIILNTFRNVDHIIHAGDLTSMEVIYQLEKLAPVSAVAGNTDPYEVFQKLGYKKIVTLGNFSFGIFHGHGMSGKTVDRAIRCFKDDTVDCIIFGHSHIPYCQYHNNILLFNPGSPTDRRGNKYYSFGIIEIEKSISLHIIYFNSEGEVVEEVTELDS